MSLPPFRTQIEPGGTWLIENFHYSSFSVVSRALGHKHVLELWYFTSDNCFLFWDTPLPKKSIKVID